MGIVESLKKLVDPEEARREADGLRVTRALPQRQDDGAPPELYSCRVCAHQGPEKIFCPKCLAETMRKP